MANIQSALLLEDRMSQPLMNIDNSLNVVEASVERVQEVVANMFSAMAVTVIKAELVAVKTTIEQIKDEFIDVEGKFVEVGDDVAKISCNVDKVEKGIEKANAAEEKFKETSERTKEVVEHSSTVYDAISKKLEALGSTLMKKFDFEKMMGLSDEMLQTSAQINLINDGMQTSKRLQDMIYQSAQNSGTAYQTVADNVVALANNAGNVFGSTAETVNFAELVSKQFALAGMSSKEADSAFSNLTEALSSGVIKGDEFNSIFAEAPNMIQTMADYLNVPIDKLEEMAEGGAITADVVKNAMLSATDGINENFNAMPATWEQIVNRIQNQALMMVEPILQKFNEIANSEIFQTLVSNVMEGLSGIVDVLTWVLDLAVNVATIIYDNWSIIAPIIGGIVAALLLYNGYLQIHKTYAMACTIATEAMKAAQIVLNTVMGMNPVMWIVFGLIALIAIVYSVVAAINQFTGTSISATGIIVGCLYTAVAFIWNLFFGLFDLVLGIINFWVNKFILFANFFANIFKNPISSVVYLFQGMADSVLGVLEKIASAMDFVFGSNMSDTVAGWRAGLKSMADNVVAKYAPNEDYQTVMDNIDLSVDSFGFERMNYKNAFNAGYDAGDNIGNKTELVTNNSNGSDVGGVTNPVNPTNTVTDLASTQAGTDIGNTAANTAEIAKSVSDSTEEIKYLRDIAERDVINRFTTAEIKVDMGGINNNVSKDTDIDGIISHLENTLYESLSSTAEQYNG
ncbi:tape measure protein [Anaerosporobacter sp.]|uniref:tape measure protein n=1 Tax=Anaerosporobacter sp. TaxID=1872529 RepID=UPI00286EEF58|nr:tape measure protein [Anaerosporobacter sp.]